MTSSLYTTQLAAGLGLIEETRVLLDLWHEGMRTMDLYQAALASGRFPTLSARRIRDLVIVSFVPRYLSSDGPPALHLKAAKDRFSKKEFEQLLFLYSCRANAILADFVRDIYWNAYTAGREVLTNEEARLFVHHAVQDGKTAAPWTESRISRMASDLTGCCADFGLLEAGAKKARKILPYRIEPRVEAMLAYDLHFAGYGDNTVLTNPDWALFGMERSDVLDDLKRLALKGLMIVQAAGGVIRISWQYKTMEELLHVLTHDELR